MRQILLLACVLPILLSACTGGTATEALNNTASAVSAEIYGNQTVVARTQSAQATQDTIPTNTPTITITPTFTLTPTPSPTFTLTPTPSPTPTPATIPALVNDWGQYAIQTLCLDVRLEYPQFDYDLKVPVRELTSKYLTRMGFNLVEPGADCDATLTIRLDIESRSDRYRDSQTNETMTCYSGSGAEGFMHLEAPGMTPLDITLSNSDTLFLVDHCVIEPNTNVNFEETWLPEVVSGLIEFWGVSVAVATLQSGDPKDSRAQRAALENYPKYKDDLIVLLPYLLASVEAGGKSLTMTPALNIIEELGRDALPAVPFLIQGIENELYGVGGAKASWPYAETLEEITGQKATKLDPDYWWDWWEANKPAGDE